MSIRGIRTLRDLNEVYGRLASWQLKKIDKLLAHSRVLLLKVSLIKMTIMVMTM